MEVGDGVLVHDAIDAIAFLLEFDPVACGPEIVAEGGKAGGGHAREDACHDGVVAWILGAVNIRGDQPFGPNFMICRGGVRKGTPPYAARALRRVRRARSWVRSKAPRAMPEPA